MPLDAYKNFAFTTVATAPSPASSGTSLVVAAGTGTVFPAVPFNAVIWPAGAQPTNANAEIVRVTARSTDTLTITRTQEGTSARSVIVGDQISAAITAKLMTDITASIPVIPPVATIYDRVTTTVDVNTSITETSIYTKTITGNDMSTNKMLRLFLMGDYLHNNVAGDTLTCRVKFGGTTFWGNASGLGGTASAVRHPWSLRLLIANLAATNSQMIEGTLLFENTGGAAPSVAGIGAALGTGVNQTESELGIATLGAIDTTANQTVDVTVQWSASAAANSWRMRYGVLELV